jgi:transglutaminase-like putative cysteine protease
MKFEIYFKAFSYMMIGVAMLALVLAGGLSVVLALLFLGLMVSAWKCEDTKWQLSERAGLVIVLLSIPLFFLDWQYQKIIGEPIERLGVNALAHLIVFLSAVKLLQVKNDRDWVFLYLISFFEILLAAGLSFSPLFLATLALYLLCGLSAVTAFEIQKARRAIRKTETRLLVPPDSRVFRKVKGRRARGWLSAEAIRLPFVALALLILIFVLALPLFLVVPRSGAAMFTRGGNGLGHFIGFSENVTLGEIGELKQDNETVMRVRVEDAQPGRELRWRGVALDEFTGRGWKKSPLARHTDAIPNAHGFFQLGTTEALHHLTTQTVFLEPLETPVLFAAPRAVAIQGDFPFLRTDGEGSVQSRRHEFDRLIYKAISDTSEVGIEALRSDMRVYPPAYQRYLQLPETLDPRIGALANAMIVNAHARNRYDEAKAIESQLQTDYSYSLQMKAGGPDPVADFLFNVKSGHCEYFSTAMALMLRTRGIASRVVNGFLPGEYNEAAGAYTVRQSDAHSWVEVYFPESHSWITFDPTPAAGKTEPLRTGLAAQLGKYAEALELMWFQYVVGYDRQEQRSLATSLHNYVFDYGRLLSQTMASIKNASPAIVRTAALFILILSGLAMLVVIVRRVKLLGWRKALRISAQETGAEYSTVVFYERLTNLLAQRGMLRDAHLTPLEFANTIKVSEALVVTSAYNRVRFGGEHLSPEELFEINRVLVDLEGDQELTEN